MTSEDYTYTNDLDDAGAPSLIARRREQNHSPLAQVVAELGGSHSNYDYLENSLSAGFDDDFEDVQAALALEDFVGVDGSNLQSESFESNSVFDIGADEPGTRTPSGASQQSISGTDFDTLPIAPMAKRPIEATTQTRPPASSTTTTTAVTAGGNLAKRVNASSSNYGTAPGAVVPSLTAALVGGADGKGPATPFKYFDLYGISSPSAGGYSTTSHPPTHAAGVSSSNANGASRVGKENNEHGATLKSEPGAAANGAIRRPAAKSTTAAANRSAAPPAPPALPHAAGTQNISDNEGFGFGIETFLHGNQFGFGRQPSFKRIAPGAATVAANVSRPYYLIPGMDGDGAANNVNANSIMAGGPGSAGTAWAAGGAGSSVNNRQTGAQRPSGVNDRNAEAFSTWLETLDPNASNANTNNNNANSSTVAPGGRGQRAGGAGSSSSTAHNTAGPSASPAVGEDFKREVDVMMKNLLGDYDLTSGTTGAYGANMSTTYGPAPVINAANTGPSPSTRRGSYSLGGGGRDTVRQLEYDAFLKDVRMLTPTTQSPVAADGEKKKPLSKSTKTTDSVAGPTTPSTDDKRRPVVSGRPSQLGHLRPQSILNGTAGAAAGGASQQPQPTPPQPSTTAATGTAPSPRSRPSLQSQHQSSSNTTPSQPTDTAGAGALPRRRRTWGDATSTSARSSGDGISGAALDPSTEAQTAETPKRPVRRVSEATASAAAVAPPQPVPPTPSSTIGPRPVAASRVPRSAAAVAAAAATADGGSSPHARRTSPGKASTPQTAETVVKSPPCQASDTYADMDEDLIAGGYMTRPTMLRSTESLFDSKSPSRVEDDSATVTLAPCSPPKDGSKASSSATSTHGRRFSTMEGHIGASMPQSTLLRQKRHPSWKMNGTATTSASADQASPAVAKPSLSPDSVNAEPAKRGTQRRTSISSLTGNKTQLSTDSGPHTNTLPLPSFPPNRASALDVPRGAAANATSPMQRDSINRRTSILTIDSVSRASRRASASPSTVEPIVFGDRERSGFLQRVSAKNSDSRDDAESSTAHTATTTNNNNNNNAQPRRRLTEFRGGGGGGGAGADGGVAPSTSRSRVSVGATATAEEARAEAERQRAREREVQQANEERRQRIQAFMAKRKAEKQLEETRRSQLVERDRQLEAFREEQERQRIHEATAPDAAGTAAAGATTTGAAAAAAAGSGLNAIKNSQRQRKPTMERPQRQSVPTASFIPDASTVPMSPAQVPTEVSSGRINTTATTTAGGSQVQALRRKPSNSPGSTTVAAKPKVRAVVVFINNSPSAADTTVVNKTEERRRLSASTAASTAVYDGPCVAMELHEQDHSLKVLQPQERPRYFAVDEYVPITDISGLASSKSSDRSSVHASRNTPITLRNTNGAPRRRLISLTLTEMSRKFIAGVNVALLLASTANAQDASVLAIREVVEGVVSHMPAQSQLYVSIAYVAGGNTQDLLVDPPRTVRSTFASSPLFGPTLDDVSYVAVTGVGQLLRAVADAYKRVKVGQQPEAGLLVLSLILKQCRDSDVVLSSYLITDAGCDVSLYTAILRKSQNAPFALFHSALGGPSLTTALMSADAEDTTAVVPLLNVQHRLSTVVNKPCHVGSVRRFMELAQRELATADGRASRSGSSTARKNSLSTLSNTAKSNSNSKLSNAARQPVAAPRTQIHKRLADQVAMAQRILDDPKGFIPKVARSADSEEAGASLTVYSMPSTAPPSAATAPRTRLTSKQEEEARGLRLAAAVAQKRNSSVTAPSSAAATAVGVTKPPAAAVVAAASPQGRAAAAAAAANAAATSTGNNVVLPSITPIVKTRPPPSMSAAPLKHPAAAPTESLAALSTMRRSSNQTLSDPHTTATSSSAGKSPTPASNGGTQAATPSVRSSRTSTTAAPQPPSSRGRAGSDGTPAPFPFRQSISNEQSVSASAEYVRRGRGSNADGGVQRNTGFMNFEDLATSQSIPLGGKTTTSTANVAAGPSSKAADHAELPPRPATTMAPTSDGAKRASDDSSSANRRRVSADGMQPFAPPSLPAGGKKLLPGATTIGVNGPQWPSTPAFEIPTIPSVASIDTSFTHDVSISMRQSSNVYDGEKAPIPASTKVRTLVVVDSRCRETSNVTYDNTMVIATTEDDFEEYDVDEVREATPGQKELIQAELLKELCDTLMMGCNAAILGADSRPTGFSAQVLKSVVHALFAEMNRDGTHRSGRLSASIVKVKGESVVDLLQDAGDAQKLVIAISPLFGSCVHGVTYAEIKDGAHFNNVIDAAVSRATAHDNGRDYGFIFCSLLIKLRLEEESDVQVCSLVATFAGENVGLYTSVLDRSPLVPRALFHYALGGPSYTIALLGIGSEETRANQMLQVQKRLGEMSNRATHPGSVAKFVAGIRNDLTPNLIAKYENSREPMERAATKEMIERLAEMVRDADALLVDFDHHQPKAYLHGDPEQQQQQQGGEAVNKPTPPPPQQHRGSTPSSVVPAASVSRDSVHAANKNAPSSDASLSTPQSVSSPARPGVAPRALPSITAVNPESEGERIQSLVCFEQVMMGAGTVAVQGNSILCASQGGTRFDSDEVITCDENHRSLSSKLMDELVAKFLSGHHTGLLAADSSYSAFTPLMLRHIANQILEAVLGASGRSSSGDDDGDNGFAFTKPPTIRGELQVSIALIKDDVTADLLPIDVDATYHRFEMEHTPLYGPRVLGVTPHLVSNPQDFDHFLAVAIDNADPALQTADPGIMVVSLVLTQRVSKPVEDVLVSSLLCTAVFDAVHHYERVLEGSPGEPLDLFKNILRGPCFSVALLGISDEEEDPGKLLRALNDLAQVRNRPPQVNSVLRHIRELQRGIVKLKERMTTSSNADEKAYIQSRVEVAEKLLEEAESLQRNSLSMMQSRAFIPLGGTADLHS